MDLKITITSPDLHDAILALAEAINTAGLPWGNPAAAFAPPPDPTVSRTQQQATAAQYAQEVMRTPPTPAPVAPQPVAPQPVAPQPVAPQPVAPQLVAPQPVAPQPVAPQPLTAPPQEYTLQQIAIWAVALQERDLPRLRQILDAFGVQALTQLPKEQYPAFVAALAAEGVTTYAR